VASGDHVFMSLDAEVSAADSLGSAVTGDGRDAHIYDGGGWNAGERERADVGKCRHWHNARVQQGCS
jgi:hypothetical protein